MELLGVKELELTDLGGPRTPGVHLSAIIRDMEKEMGKDREDEDLGPTSKASRQFEKGFIWEDVYGREFRRRMSKRRPKQYHWMEQFEILKDGIYMTPDAIRCGKLLTLEETKATYRSCAPFDEDPVAALFEGFWSWGTQMMGYCRAMDLDRAD